MNIKQSYLYCQRLAAQHYENFPVGSLLIRKDLRPHVHAIYAFARTADDFADEPGLQKEERLKKLAEWDQMLDEAVAGRAEHPVFIAVADTLQKFQLPPELFHRLVQAFRQDVSINRYSTMKELLTIYCRNSADPVGRLVLLLHGYRDEELMTLSDAICSALQLANFWQDTAIDLDKDRIYLPQEDLSRFSILEKDLFRREATPEFKRLLRHEIDFTRTLFDKGAALLPRLRGRLGLEIKATWLGGIGILDKIERVDYDVFRQRPHWSKWEMVGLFLKTILLHSPITLPLSPLFTSNFYLAMRLLPKEKRQPMFTFYQFCQRADDAVDLAPSRAEGERELSLWKNELRLCYDGTPAEPLTKKLKEVIRKYKIPFEEINAILRGIEMDLHQPRFQTFQELEEYCYCVASAVGLVSARIFGISMSRGSDFATLLGKALQLTNILRDLKEDARKGRVYLPQNELEQFDYPEEKLLRSVQDTAFMKLADFQCSRVRLFFNKADAAFSSLTFDDQKRFFPARIMEEIYKSILEQIEKNPYNIFNKRISVPKWKKAVVALDHWIESHIK